MKDNILPQFLIKMLDRVYFVSDLSPQTCVGRICITDPCTDNAVQLICVENISKRLWFVFSCTSDFFRNLDFWTKQVFSRRKRAAKGVPLQFYIKNVEKCWK